MRASWILLLTAVWTILFALATWQAYQDQQPVSMIFFGVLTLGFLAVMVQLARFKGDAQ